MDDREPVNESGDKTEDNDDSQNSVQANPARIGNQTIPPLREVSPEDQELLSGISEASASSTRNRNINQLGDLFRSSRHLRISTNCSLLADALLSPRYYSRLSNESGKNFSAIGLQDLAPVRQGQSGHRDLPSDTEASSSQDQKVIHPEEASSRNALASNRRHQRVSSLPDSEHSNVSSLDSNERGGSLSAESRDSDCPSPLLSSSVRETKLIHQPGKKARKSFKLKEANTSSATGSFETGIQSTSEHSDASSIETNERGASLSSESRGSDCASPLQSSSVRETEQIPQPGKKARKSFKSKEAITSSATGSFKTGIQSTSEHSDASSVESNKRGASLLGESRASDCASPLQSSATLYVLGLGVRARKTVASSRKYSKTNTTLAKRGPETSMGSTSAETELSESESGESFESKPSPSAAEGTLDDSSSNAEARGARIADQEAETSGKRERESSDSSENEDSRRQRKIPAGEINAEARGKSIADQEAETSRKRERESSDSSENEDSRRQRKIPSGERPLNEESSFSIAEGTLDNSQISIGASAGREQSEAMEPYLHIGPGQPSGSGHQPLVSANFPASDESGSSGGVTICLELADIFEEFQDRGEGALVIFDTAMRRYLEQNYTAKGQLTVGRKLRRYLADRQEKWLEISQSLSGMELEIRQTYENCMRILVQLIIAIFSQRSCLDYHLVMLNYRNFANFHFRFWELCVAWNNENVQDMESASRMRMILKACKRVKKYFIELRQNKEHFYSDILPLYFNRPFENVEILEENR